jgi:type I restriction enzyme S subunit
MVPSGWKNKKLGIVAELQRGFDLPARNRINGSIPIISSSGYSGFHNEAKVKAPGIVTGRYGSIGKVFFITEDFWPLNTSLWVKNFYGNDPKYLFYLLSKIDYKKFSDKTGVPGINRNDLHTLNINVPPLPEQQKIVQTLSTWDKAISTTESLISNSQQQKKSLMQQLLTGKKRFVGFEDKWEEKTLAEIAIYRRGSFPQPYGNPEWIDEINGYPFVQVYDIGKNMRLKPDTKIKISDVAIGKSVFIPKETIIISIQGSIGRVAITQYDAYVDRTILLFQEYRLPMDKVFFAYSLQELFEIEKTKAPGGTIKTITKQVLSHFTIKIPPIIEQQKIASALTAADQEIDTLQQKLAYLKQEKKALMQQLLTGKRRVMV